MNTINVAKQLNTTTAITRESARELFSMLKQLSEYNIVLDFDEVEYASRSFFDELNSLRIEAKTKKKVNFINLNRDLQALLYLVTTKKTSSHDDKTKFALKKIKTIAI